MIRQDELQRASQTLFIAEWEGGRLKGGGYVEADREIYQQGFLAGAAYVQPDSPPTVVSTADELEKLRAFKAYVHRRLDDMGVPAFEHAECRVGCRLSWVAESRS